MMPYFFETLGLYVMLVHLLLLPFFLYLNFGCCKVINIRNEGWVRFKKCFPNLYG